MVSRRPTPLAALLAAFTAVALSGLAMPGAAIAAPRPVARAAAAAVATTPSGSSTYPAPG